jgi:2'-5' RNA ligase
MDTALMDTSVMDVALTGTAPLIVTLLVADSDQRRFDDLRQRHFPADRNYIAAHVTLFHALPGARVNDVDRSVADAARRPAFDVQVTGVRMLGRGIAFELHSTELTGVHARLRAQWQPHLSPQDAQPLRAHVTVQNKVSPDIARALHADLSAGFEPYDVHATGLALWRYRGGPWEPISRHLFT